MRNKEEKEEKVGARGRNIRKERERERKGEKNVRMSQESTRFLQRVFSILYKKKVFDPEGEKNGEKTRKERSEYHAEKPRKKKGVKCK